MIAKLITVIGLLVNLIFLVGAMVSFGQMRQVGMSLGTIGFWWPMLVALTAVVVESVYLRYLMKLDKRQPTARRALIWSVVIFLTPFLIRYVLGWYYAAQMIRYLKQPI